ncbi:MAG: NAD(P)-dependent oxidoreductase [Pseudomonadota bacterium]
MKPAILLMFKPRPELREKLAAHYRLIGPFKSPETELDGADARQIVAAVTLGPIEFGGALIALLPGLKLIAVYGAGFERVDLDAAWARNIQITNGAGGNASCVADTAIALLLAAIIRIPQADALVRSGEWERMPPRSWIRQPGVGGRRLGILGLGNIGGAIATRAQAFELEIGYHNRSPRGDVAYCYFPTLAELAGWADYLVIAAPGNSSTRAIVDEDVLQALGRSGYLINIARGSLVDEPALIRALETGEIAGAGLDVFAHEPKVAVELRSAPNTVFTPHIGGFSVRSAENLDVQLMESLAALSQGRPLANVLKP